MDLCMSRLSQFFEGDNGRLSMTRLLMFMSFAPATYVVTTSKSADTLGWYIGGYVLGYAAGKGADVMMSKKHGVGE